MAWRVSVVVGCAIALLWAPLTARAQDAGVPPSGQPAQSPQDQAAPGPTTTTTTGTSATTTTPTTAQPAPAVQQQPEPAAEPAQTSTYSTSYETEYDEYGHPRVREEEDEEIRPGLLWIEAFGGAAYANLLALSTKNFLPEAVQLKGVGPSGGLALGLRFSLIAIGARVSLASYPDFDLGTATGELALRIKLDIAEAYVRGGFGYGWVGSANYDDPSLSDTNVYGYLIQGALGIAFYLSKLFSLGFGLDVDVLNLTRQRIDMAGAPGPTEVDLREDGDAVGLQARAQANLTLHIF